MTREWDGEDGKVLPAEVLAMANLRVLRFNSMRLAELPAGLGKLTKLVELNLDGAERLKALPSTLGKLASLVRLELQFTYRLKELPPSVGSLGKLQWLRANPSGLKSVPKTLWNAKNLRWLALPDSVKSLPPGVSTLPKLEELELGQAALESIVDELPRM